MPDDSAGVYKVTCTPAELEKVKAWAEKAADLGMRDSFLAALKTIQAALATDPLTWGDPTHHLSHLGLLMCHRSYWMLHVQYGVDEANRLVFIKAFKLLPGPLRDQTS